MYKTKLLHKSIVDGGAYTSVGDPYKDPVASVFREKGKGEKAPTPFHNERIPVNDGNGYFTKSSYTPSDFKETIIYQKLEPLEKRRNGFGTHDATRWDEFTSTTRSGQFRESLKKELRHLPKPSEEMFRETEKMTRAMTAPSSDYPYRLTVTNFDIGRNQVTEFNPKATRDRYYKMATNREKCTGAYRPSSAAYGEDAWNIEYKPPVRGNVKETEKFWDKSHL